MKKAIFPLFLITIVAVSLFSKVEKAYTYVNGSPGYKSGGPSSGGATCASCHGETVSNLAATSGGFIITKNGVTVTTYNADSTYDVSFGYIGNTGTKRTGFETCTELAGTSGGFIGTNNTPGSGAKMIVSSQMVTHTTTKTGTNPTWTYKWTAPVSGTGSVTFYGVLRIDNTGIYKSNLTLTETIVTPSGISNVGFNTINTVPNPTNDFCKINIQAKEVMAYNAIGALVPVNFSVNGSNTTIDISTLKSSEYYFLKIIDNNGKQFSSKIFKN